MIQRVGGLGGQVVGGERGRGLDLGRLHDGLAVLAHGDRASRRLVLVADRVADERRREEQGEEEQPDAYLEEPVSKPSLAPHRLPRSRDTTPVPAE